MTAEFTDPRLVAVYETINAYDAGTQPDFVSQLAAEIGATAIVDLGCGTGLITRELARQGYTMIGVEPAPAMLEIARQRPYGDQVQWIDGGADAIGTPDADLAIMTGHVAQFFVTDESWSAALVALHRALRPGGWLAFESRNPEARGWSSRTATNDSRSTTPLPGAVDTWVEVDEVRDAVVSYTIHYLFAATGEELLSPTQLRFRSEAELTRSLADAGFTIEHLYGDLGPPPRRLHHPRARRRCSPLTHFTDPWSAACAVYATTGRPGTAFTAPRAVRRRRRLGLRPGRRARRCPAG